jgi:exopolyphosphatase/guanosine-5'-triphosphate,3'-diphosphate pyrophosphatase
VDSAVSPRIRELVSSRLLDRARVLGAAMRVAYILSAAMPGVLPVTPLAVEGKKLVLRLPEDRRDLGGDRVVSRLKTLARLLGREPLLEVV